MSYSNIKLQLEEFYATVNDYKDELISKGLNEWLNLFRIDKKDIRRLRWASNRARKYYNKAEAALKRKQGNLCIYYSQLHLKYSYKACETPKITVDIDIGAQKVNTNSDGSVTLQINYDYKQMEIKNGS